MDEICIERGKVLPAAERVHQLLAHRHQRARAARREIEPAEQFLSPWLGRGMEFGGGGVSRLFLPGGNRLLHALIVRAKPRCQRLKEEAERVPLKSPLDGKELMELFQRPPGPWLRPLKEHLLGLVIDGALSPDDKEEAARIARELVNAGQEQNGQAGQARNEISLKETSL